MIRRSLQTYFEFILRIGVSAHDSDELRLQKSLLVSASPALSLAGAAWSVVYFASGELIASLIPGGYAVLSALNLLLFARRRNFRFFRFTQLLLILLLPFLLQIALGGFINSSAVVLWSLICPMGALIFAGPRQATRWFVLYLLLVAVSAALFGVLFFSMIGYVLVREPGE